MLYWNLLFLCRGHHLSVDHSEDGEDDDEEEEFSADEFVQGTLETEKERYKYSYCVMSRRVKQRLSSKTYFPIIL